MPFLLSLWLFVFLQKVTCSHILFWTYLDHHVVYFTQNENCNFSLSLTKHCHSKIPFLANIMTFLALIRIYVSLAENVFSVSVVMLTLPWWVRSGLLNPWYFHETHSRTEITFSEFVNFQHKLSLNCILCYHWRNPEISLTEPVCSALNVLRNAD